ncbi:hypothetical protein G9Q20_18865, partial [Klebsiella pneumoniae]|uniref:hypothetical protein n=1 Tax=Klebsiella pneumoniae TaxID=573 RepID=UPI00148EFC28
LERWIKGSAILGCVGCLVGHLFMFLVGGKTPDQSVHLNLTTTNLVSSGIKRANSGAMRLNFTQFVFCFAFIPIFTASAELA